MINITVLKLEQRSLPPTQKESPMTTFSKICLLCLLPWTFWCPQQTLATNNSERVSPITLERIKQTTVGILQHPETETKTHPNATFAIRGTGVHIGDGFIVTAKHAVTTFKGGSNGLPQSIYILTTDLQELSAGLIGTSHFLDMAVYRIQSEAARKTIPTAHFSDSPIQPGEEVFTIGYPLGWGPAYAFGRVGNPNTFLPTAQTRLLQIDLATCQGNSGGGLFNTDGEIVGMVQAIIQTETQKEDRRCSRFAFVVPGHFTKKISNALIQGDNPHFSRLGITMTRKKVGNMWRIAVAKATGPARKGGLRKGDIILAIDDREFSTAAQLKNYLIEETQPGQKIDIRVLRGQNENTYAVTLGES